MGPEGGGEHAGELADAIDSAFGSFEGFNEQFASSAAPGALFGSGWAWLIASSDVSPATEATPNQDRPLMEGKTPVLGLDVWERAYYLKYQNRPPEYIENWWNVVAWDKVARRFEAARS